MSPHRHYFKPHIVRVILELNRRVVEARAATGFKPASYCFVA
jgi:hypothetical protein